MLFDVWATGIIESPRCFTTGR